MLDLSRRSAVIVAALERALVIALLGANSLPAGAAGIVGDGTPASCTSAALASAVAAGSGDITFACGAAPVTIVIATPGGLVIPSGVDITIDGNDQIELSGGLAWRVFVVNSGGSLTLRNLSIVKGFSPSDDGGAIRNDGTLFISYCTFSENQTTAGWSGGAILTYGPLTIYSSEFRNNQAGNGGAIYPRFAAAVTTITDTTFDLNFTTNLTNGWGGAMLVWDGAPVTLNRTNFHDNTARANGGAIFVEGAATTLTVNASQFSGNLGQTSAAMGGAIYSQGTLLISDSTFQTNHAGNGGAIFNDGGSTDLQRSTFSGNWAYFGGAYQHGTGLLEATDSWFHGNGYDLGATPTTINGGAINTVGGFATLTNLTVDGNYSTVGGGLFLGGTTSVTNVTVSGNHAVSGGGINKFNGDMTLTNVTVYQNVATKGTGGVEHSGGTSGTATARNTIVANNTGADPDGSNVRSRNCDAPFGSFAFDLSTDATCGFGVGRDNVANMLLAALANTGGYSPTHSPLPGSPAIDNASGLYCPVTDERGVVRAGKGSACDVGAVEYVAAPPLVLQTVVSRKAHGAAGTFDLGLGLVPTNPTTEPRSSGAGGSHTIVFTFDQPVTSGNAAISAGTAVAGTPTFSGNSMIVPLTGVANQQYVTVAVSNVIANAGGTGGGSVRLGFLQGDVNQSRVVTVADLGLVNAQLAQPVTAANFLKDVNASGTLTVADKGITNANLTHALPAP